MKSRFVFPMLISSLLIFLGSCKKNTGNSESENAANNIIETAAPIQKPITFNVTNNIGGFQQALPALYDSTSKKYPLILFIHGTGELGNGSSDLWMAANVGTPSLIKNKRFPPNFTSNGKNFSFIVLSPQFKVWPTPGDVNAMINYAITKYRVDTSRIYVSGLSMGGGVTWEYASDYTTRVAAIAPICGASGPTNEKAQKIAQGGIAVWAFHNQDDTVVPPSNSVGYVNKINSYNPSKPALITVWPSGGHDAWSKATDPTYKENGMNMYEWLLQYSR